MPWHPEIGAYPSAADEPLSLLEWQALQYRLAHDPGASGRAAFAAPNGLIEAVRLDFQRYQHAVAVALALEPRLGVAAAEARYIDLLFPPSGRWH